MRQNSFESGVGARIVISGLMFLSVILPGCAVLTYGTFSSVDESNQTIVDRASLSWNSFRGMDTVEFEQFRLRIMPRNERISLKITGLVLPLVPYGGGSNASELITEQLHHDAFLITVALEPRSPRLSFDHAQVSLLLDDGSTSRPVGYWGCYDYWDYIEHKMKRPPSLVSQGDQVPAVGHLHCVTLLYNTPAPSKPFRLSIEGAREGDAVLSLKPITFLPHSEWDYSFVYPQ